MSSVYRISKSSFTKIIDKVCNAIVLALKNDFVKPTKENWVQIANQFNAKWNLPNCVGAVDGRHVPIVCPKNSGSLFFNYKVSSKAKINLLFPIFINLIHNSFKLQKFFSIVMMAISDADYKFIFIDAGAFGSEGDGGVFARTCFGKKIYDDELTSLPESTTLGNFNIPYYFVADDVFSLRRRVMKPYTTSRTHPNLTPEEITFNYRLSRARRCIENAFGIMVTKFAILNSTIRHPPDRVVKILMACTCLHNHLIVERSITYCPPQFADYINENGDLVEGEWRQNIFASNNLDNSHNRETEDEKIIRNILKDYVNSPTGAVPWQANV